MGDAADFSAYVVARWPALVRTLVLLGCAPGRAEEVAREGLARAHPSFERVRRDQDVDVHVYRTVLETWRHRLRKGGLDEPQPGAGPVRPQPVLADPTGPDPETRRALLRSLESALAHLAPDHRLVLVLRHMAGLDEAQVSDVLGMDVWEVDSLEHEALGLADLASLHRDFL